MSPRFCGDANAIFESKCTTGGHPHWRTRCAVVLSECLLGSRERLCRQEQFLSRRLIPFDLAQPRGAGIGSHGVAAKNSHHAAPVEVFRLQRVGVTLCRHRHAGVMRRFAAGCPPVIDWVIAHAMAANEVPVVQPHRTLHGSPATISTRNRSALQRLCQSHRCIVFMRYFYCANSGHSCPLEIGIYVL